MIYKYTYLQIIKIYIIIDPIIIPNCGFPQYQSLFHHGFARSKKKTDFHAQDSVTNRIVMPLGQSGHFASPHYNETRHSMVRWLVAINSIPQVASKVLGSVEVKHLRSGSKLTPEKHILLRYKRQDAFVLGNSSAANHRNISRYLNLRNLPT